MAENIDVNVNINTSQASRNLDNLNRRVGTVQKSFAGLKTALSGIAFGALVTNALNFANSIKDVSNATGLAIPNVVGFTKAIQQNGGTAENATAAMNKFVLTLGEAAEGSAKTQNAFSKVGVSLNDLGTLSEQQLFDKTIKGLSQIADRAQRAKVANELFGKSLRGIDLQGLAGGYDAAVRRSRQYTEAIEKGAKVSEDIKGALYDLQLVLLNLLTPLSDLAKGISKNIDSIMTWTKVIFEFIKVAGGLFLLGRIFQLLSRGVNAIKGFIVAWKQTKQALRDVQNQTILTNSGILKVIRGVETFIRKNPELAKFRDQFIRLRDAAKTAATAIGTTVLSVLGLTAAYQKFKELTQEDFSKPLVIEGQGAQAIPEDFFQRRREQLREIEEAYKKEKKAIQEVTAAYQRNTAEQIANINIQRLSLDMSQDEVEVMNAVDEVIKRNEESIRKLREQKEGLASDSQLIPAINAEIAILERLLETDKRVTAEAVRELQKRQLEQEKLNLILEQTQQRIADAQALSNLNAQLALVGQYGDELENNLLILEVTQELQRKLTDLGIRQLELEQQRIQLGEARFRQEMQHLEALREAAYEYAGARLEAEQKILQAQKAVQENARLGVEQALQDISKQFEPYTMAQDAILSTWNKIGNAVDEFVKTGKFKFSDFAKSVLRDLAAMIIKAQIFKAISGLAGAFGLKIPGLASGGSAKAGNPYIVGEKGPELFVPKQSGTVVPNNKLDAATAKAGGGTVNAPVTNNYITNNINAVDAKSVAQLFAENRKTLLGAVATAQREMPYMA